MKTNVEIMSRKAMNILIESGFPKNTAVMPSELIKAHNMNNKAVMEAYGFSTKMSEAECVAELMRMYQKLMKEK